MRCWVEQLQFERKCGVPKSETLTDEQKKIQELESRIHRLEREKANLKKGYSALGVGRDQSIQLIDILRAHESVEFVCRTLGVSRSVYYAAKQRKKTIDLPRMILRIQVRKLFRDSRRSVGSRTLMGQLRELGYPVGRYKVRRLMAEANLVSSQPGHKYKKMGQARVDIPNLLERQFSVAQPNRVWCGVITYVWAGDLWHYLAVVMELHPRLVVGFALSDKSTCELVTTAVENAIRERRPGPRLMFCSDQTPNIHLVASGGFYGVIV